MLSFLAISCLILLLPQLSAQRIEAAPAVWGDPAPDYSAVVLDNTVRYVYALLFIDDKIASYYEYDMLRVKEEVLKVVTEANNYFIQLKISVAVVDVLQTRRSNLSLLMFQEYRSVRKNELPYHDFAALMTMKYPGGLAYVSGMCTDLSVMLCGYYPSDPQVMGSIFFHEAAHLFGVPHRPANVSLHVPNCACTGNEGPSTGGCLKIPGFDHDCTAQQLANTLYKSKCLNTKPVQMKTLALCGNGVLEPGEYCDCGKNLTCNVFNCVPATCSYKIRPLWMYLFFFWLFCLTLLILFVIQRRRGSRMFNSLNCFRSPSTSSKGFKNVGTDGFYSGNPGYKDLTFPPKSSDPNSVVLLLDKPPRPAVATLQRPKVAPPPPPPRAKLFVEAPSNYYEVPNCRNSYFSSERDNISDKFRDFDSDDDGPIYNSYLGQPGVPTIPSYTSQSPINRVVVNQYKRGSNETVDTHCGSSSTSSTGLSGSTTPL